MGKVVVEAESLAVPWAVEFTTGVHRGHADTSKNGVGGTAGMRPHELLEAALASCMAITARLILEEEGLHDIPVRTSVKVEREQRVTRFRCTLSVDTDKENIRERLYDRVATCPVKTTLSKPLEFDLVVD